MDLPVFFKQEITFTSIQCCSVAHLPNAMLMIYIAFMLLHKCTFNCQEDEFYASNVRICFKCKYSQMEIYGLAKKEKIPHWKFVHIEASTYQLCCVDKDGSKI